MVLAVSSSQRRALIKLQIMKKKESFVNPPLLAYIKRLERAVRLKRLDNLVELLKEDNKKVWNWVGVEPETKTDYNDLKQRAWEMTNSN